MMHLLSTKLNISDWPLKAPLFIRCMVVLIMETDDIWLALKASEWMFLMVESWMFISAKTERNVDFGNSDMLTFKKDN